MILDTNALSALAEGDAALGRVLAGQNSLAIPIIVLGEYLFGIRQSRERARYERWLKERLRLFTMLGADSDTAREYADIRTELKADGKPIPMNDLWIAAIARQNRAPLVSRDNHFQAVRALRLLSW